VCVCVREIVRVHVCVPTLCTCTQTLLEAMNHAVSLRMQCIGMQ
jgi:hypothetical protein